ncbi:type II secretion system minor pseudopilin GspH [Legionella adelaidensis]|nr:type II secretion system minor pseudopilin GspH [Legionella adelaidensis]
MLNKVRRGFTLIEILIVLVIIGITLSFALLAFGDFGESRRVTIAAEEFVNYLQLIKQRAILESSTFGIAINQNSYTVLRYVPPNKWENLPAKGVFHPRNFPKNAQIQLISERKSNPSIVINNAGDITPFSLRVNNEKKQPLVTINGTNRGEFFIEKPK